MKIDINSKGELKRNLIPYNMVLVLVSIVAIISLFFFPILTINLGQMMTGLLVTAPNEDDELSASSASIVLLLKALDTKLEFTMVDFAGIAFDKNPGATMLTEYVLGEDNLVESAVLSMVASTVLKDNLPTMSELRGLDLTAVNSELYALEKEGADPVEVAHNYVDKLNVELERVGAEAVPSVSVAEAAFNDMYSTVCNQMGGKFTVEGFICLGLCAGQENPPTTYREFAERVANGDVPENVGDAYENISADFDAALTVFEPIASIGGYMKYVFFVLLALIAPWVFLLFFALLHILLPNKKVSIWYVMAFGALPALLFWVIPFVLGKILGLFSNEMLGIISVVLGAIGSYAWISGICFLFVWILDMVWAHRIKRQLNSIEKYEKRQKLGTIESTASTDTIETTETTEILEKPENEE